MKDPIIIEFASEPKFIPATNEQYEFIEELATVIENAELKKTPR